MLVPCPCVRFMIFNRLFCYILPVWLVGFWYYLFCFNSSGIWVNFSGRPYSLYCSPKWESHVLCGLQNSQFKPCIWPPKSPIDLLLSWVLEEKVLLSSYWHLNEENPALGSVASAHQYDQKAHDYGWEQGPQYCCPWGVFTHRGRQRYLSKFVTQEAGILPILQLVRSLALTNITGWRNPARERI